MYKKMMNLLAVGLIFSMMIAAGCGRTASNGIVSKKDPSALAEAENTEKETPYEEQSTNSALDVLASEARENAAERETESENQVKLRKELGAPGFFTKETMEYGGKTYMTSASLYLPEGNEFKSIPISMRYFSEEELQKYAEILLGDGGLYERNEESAYKINEQENIIWKLSGLLEESEKFSENELYILEGQYDQALEKRNELISDAQRFEIPLEFVTEEKMEGSGAYVTHLRGLTDWDRGTMEFDMTTMGFVITPAFEIEENSCTLPEKEAKEIAGSMVEKLGMSEEMILVNSEKNERMSGIPAAYRFTYMRQINGVPIQYEAASSLCEELVIRVDDRGVLGVNYHFPFVMDDSSVTDDTLLPFEEIEKIYEKAITRAGLREYEEREAAVINIDEVRLGYELIYNEGADTGCLIPAWNFYGSVQYHYVYDPDVKAGYTKEEIEARDGSWEQFKILSIDATNGTVLK